MPTYIYPDVFIRTRTKNTRPITGVGTSIACFIGHTKSGPVGVPVKIEGWVDYQKYFGGLSDIQDAVAGSRFSSGDDVGLAVKAFFANGGSTSYIVRTANSTPLFSEYEQALLELKKRKGINIVLLPGLVWDTRGRPFFEMAITHCDHLENRMVIIDLPPGLELATEADVVNLALPSSAVAVSYYPWPVMPNPLYNARTNAAAAPDVLVSPAALAAAIWVRTDTSRGVWKAPAGSGSHLAGISDLEFAVGDTEQRHINPHGVNAIRFTSALGTVIWGSRTLATANDPEWRYIPVRRTAMFIEESVRTGTQWAVFESNNSTLWSSIRTQAESFLGDLFRHGAFQGEKPSNAYFVRCGLGETMTVQDIANRTLLIELGFAPFKPAEFIVVTIRHKLRR